MSRWYTFKPLEHHRLVVVGALHQPSAAAPQRAGRAIRAPVARCRRRSRRTRRRPAATPSRRTSSASRAPSMSTTISGVAAVHQAVERLGLRDRPRKPVEDEPVPRVRPVEPLPHDPDHHLVAHQLAALHDRLGAQPDRRFPPSPPRAGCRRSRSSGCRGRARTARPACPCRRPEAQHDQIQRHDDSSQPPRRPRMRVFFMKPS